MKDLDLFSIEQLSEMVYAEGFRQISLWGIQDHTPFEWMTYLTEEVGELAQAISEHNYRNGPREQVVTEAIQSATLCLKIAEMYMYFEKSKTPKQKGQIK